MKRRKLLAGSTTITAIATCALTAGLILGGVGGLPASAGDTTSTTTSTTTPSSTTSSSSTSSTTSTTLGTAPPSTTTVPATTSTTQPAQDLIAQALVAVEGQRGVKWKIVVAAGRESVVESVHAGLADGVMTDTFSEGVKGSVKYVLHNRLYFEGNAFGLEQDLRFKTKYATKEANRWLSASASSSYFVDQVGLLTVSGVAGSLDLVGATDTVLPETTVNGLSVIPVEEMASEKGEKFSQTVYLRATGRTLPVQIIEEIDGLEAVLTFSDWGVPPDAQPPKHATAFQGAWLSATS